MLMWKRFSAAGQPLGCFSDLRTWATNSRSISRSVSSALRRSVTREVLQAELLGEGAGRLVRLIGFNIAAERPQSLRSVSEDTRETRTSLHRLKQCQSCVQVDERRRVVGFALP